MSSLKIDYIHRTGHTENLTDSILLISDRALGVLTLLSCQFDDKDSYCVNYKMVHAAICSVMADFEDVSAVVKAHHEAEFSKRQEKIALVK